MTLDDLHTYIAVCESGNLSAVARDLGCTQPAVSQHISRLEKELGVALLERRAKGVFTTEAGKIFYHGALEGIDAIKLAVRQMQQFEAGEAGALGIATGGTTVRHFMKQVVVGFRQDYPKVELNFHSLSSNRRCIDALRNEQADLAFVTMGQTLKGIEQQAVLQMPWVLVTPKNHAMANKSSVSPKDLRDISYIRLRESSTSQSQLTELLSDFGVKLQSSTLVDDWDTAILFVSMGLGYAITPAVHAEQLGPSHKVVGIPIVGIPPVSFGWACRRWSALSRVAKGFVDLFAEQGDYKISK